MDAIKFDLQIYDRAKAGTYEKSYDFLRQAIMNHINKERQKKSRAQIHAAIRGGRQAAPGKTKKEKKEKKEKRAKSAAPARGRSTTRKGRHATRDAGTMVLQLRVPNTRVSGTRSRSVTTPDRRI